jgi:putative hydrolase of the HAD superfamily
MNKYLLLDFGCVVLKSNFELGHLAEPTLGPITWRGPFDPSTDPEWRSFQTGEITEREYWEIRASAYGMDTKQLMRQFYEPSGDHLVRDEMVVLIEQYRADGGVVGMLTNDLQAFHGPAWMDGISVIKQFDFIVDGSITGILKPRPEAFQFALEAFGNPDPADVVFVDDQPINIAGGDAMGLTTVWFDVTDVPGSIARIQAAL